MLLIPQVLDYSLDSLDSQTLLLNLLINNPPTVTHVRKPKGNPSPLLHIGWSNTTPTVRILNALTYPDSFADMNRQHLPI
jgi:hypothetical protein